MKIKHVLSIGAIFLIGCTAIPKYDPYINAECFCSDSGGIGFYRSNEGVICKNGANANLRALQEINLCKK